ncbi:hypothetical protein ACU8V3_03960 [Cobetia marina]
MSISKKKLHAEDDPYSAVLNVENKGSKFIVGHFKASRYAFQIPISKFVTILRDPIQRFYSEYNHRSNRDFDRFTGTIEDYCQEERFCNIQSKMLAGVAWPAFGCVGLTEEYNKSMYLINSELSVELEYMEVNKRRGDIEKGYDLSPAQLELISKCNKGDIELYNAAVDYFNQRISLTDEHSFVRGRIEFIKDNIVSGYAIPAEDNSPAVVVEILANGIVIGEAIAKRHRKYLALLSVSRKGYVGFEFKLGDLPEKSVISARVKDTHQYLAYTIET